RVERDRGGPGRVEAGRDDGGRGGGHGGDVRMGADGCGAVLVQGGDDATDGQVRHRGTDVGHRADEVVAEADDVGQVEQGPGGAARDPTVGRVDGGRADGDPDLVGRQ